MLKQKKTIIDEFKKSDYDTGSIEVQIALITARINSLAGHFKTHKKDFGSKRGLLILVGQRKRYLRYLERTNRDGYVAIIGKLGIRK